MRVVIDANPLFPISSELGPTGVGRWTAGSLHALSEAAPTWTLDLIAFHLRGQVSFDTSMIGPNARFMVKRFPNRVYRKLRGMNALPPLEWIVGPLDAMLAPAFVAWRTSNAAEIPVIHDLSFRRYPESVSRRNLYFLKWNVPRVIKRAALVVTVSEAMRVEIMDEFSLPPEKVAVVPDGCDLERFNGDTRTDMKIPGLPDRYLLFIGTREPRKNLLNVLKAFDELLRVDPSVPPLVVVGGAGWRGRSIEDELNRRIDSPHVRVMGYLADELLPIVYARASVLVFPSLYEGFGLPIVEAMASGTPVITSDRGAMAEIAGDAALFVDPSDPTDIARAMQQGLSGDVEELIALGRDRARRYSWERSGESLKEVIERAVATRG